MTSKSIAMPQFWNSRRASVSPCLRGPILFALSTAAAAVLFGGIASPGSATAPTSRPAALSVLARKSIFARDRVSRAPSGDGPTTTPAGVSAPSIPVLAGIIRDDLGFVAVVEIPDLGKLVQLHVGDTLPGSSDIISDITLDYLQSIAQPGQPPRRITVGRNIQGGEVVLPTSTSDASTTQPVIEGDDLVSRMRRRRQQEMNR